MMLVKNYVAASNIHGLGLFAAEPIKKDSLIWLIDERVDRVYSKEEFEALPEMLKTYFRTYGYIEKVDNRYYLEVDNGKYSNHSETPNTYFSKCGLKWYALRDIAEGEEITCNYGDFDAEWEDQKSGYKS